MHVLPIRGSDVPAASTHTYSLSVLQASNTVQHLCLPCHWTQRSSIVADYVRSYGTAGRTIVFCDTKKDVNELVTSLADTCGAQALHGDIPQVCVVIF